MEVHFKGGYTRFPFLRANVCIQLCFLNSKYQKKTAQLNLIREGIVHPEMNKYERLDGDTVLYRSPVSRLMVNSVWDTEYDHGYLKYILLIQWVATYNTLECDLV